MKAYPTTGIVHVGLNHFRSHKNLVWNSDKIRHIALTAPNGLGKTNFLEALSLLSPGRGFRYAAQESLQNFHDNLPWTCHVTLCTPEGEVSISLQPTKGGGSEKTKRQTLVEGVPLKRKLDLAEYLSVFWVVPWMDSLFREGMSARRRFFDRLVLNMVPHYGVQLLRYDKALRERRRLLESQVLESGWLDGLEDIMAEASILLGEARDLFLRRLNKEMLTQGRRMTPVQADAQGAWESIRKERGIEEATSWLRTRFKELRRVENYVPPPGPHQTKFCVIYNGEDISLSSTGQQKVSLTRLVLGGCTLQASLFPERPIIFIFDDMAAHLDRTNCQRIYEQLTALPNLQLWISGTHPDLFQGFDVTLLDLSQPGKETQRSLL
jgi:DNA replication and repair protein RecF